MADVAANLGALAEAYANPGACNTKCLSDRTGLFFYDCLPHLMTAAQIYDEIPQVFEEQKGVHDWEGFVDDASGAGGWQGAVRTVFSPLTPVVDPWLFSRGSCPVTCPPPGARSRPELRPPTAPRP